MNKKYNFTIVDAKKFLNKRGLELFKRSVSKNSNQTFKSLYYTFFAGCIIISISFLSPIFKSYKNEIFSLSEEVKNYNIDINAIAPGPLNTGMLNEVLKAGPRKVGKEFYKKSLILLPIF